MITSLDCSVKPIISRTPNLNKFIPTQFTVRTMKKKIILIGATGITFNTAVINSCCIYIQKRDHIFLSFTTKPLSVASMLQILLSENPESNILPCESRRAIIQRACACYDREVEREKTNSRAVSRASARDRKCQKCSAKPDLVQQYHSQLTLLVKSSLLIFSQPGDSERVSGTVRAAIKLLQVPGST